MENNELEKNEKNNDIILNESTSSENNKTTKDNPPLNAKQELVSESVEPVISEKIDETVRQEKIKNMKKRYKNQKPKFIAGCVFFALSIICFVLIMCFIGNLIGTLQTSFVVTDLKDVPLRILLGIIIFPVILIVSSIYFIPFLTFAIISLVLLHISCHTDNKKVKWTSVGFLILLYSMILSLVIIIISAFAG